MVTMPAHLFGSAFTLTHAPTVKLCAAVKRSGMNSVPTFVINGRAAFSGAQRAELILAHLLEAAGPS